MKKKTQWNKHGTMNIERTVTKHASEQLRRDGEEQQIYQR